MNFKFIHIGSLIYQIVKERDIEIYRICNFLKCTVQDVDQMYQSQSMDSTLILRWSKLLEYDLFRIYSQHLILFAPHSLRENEKKRTDRSTLPKFRKNIYTKEVINFILEQIQTGEMTRMQIIERYRIPKTTLYKWISKYKI